MNQCPRTDCIITSNRHYMPNISDFDAVLFYGHNKDSINSFPKWRRPEQVYVLSFIESPYHVWQFFKTYSPQFNWTMSYRFESDVFWPYGYFVDKETGGVTAPSKRPYWRSPRPARQLQVEGHIMGLITRKTKTAAWFASNCQFTPSHRYHLVDAMEQFADIDSYGSCGDMECPKSNAVACREMLEENYFFYLAFENSLCEDYITEKVFANMQYYIVPVLFNGAENKRFLPPHSYINAEDFSTVEELTKYLVRLVNSPVEYASYFWWKEFYELRNGQNFCDLCDKLHDRSIGFKSTYYRDFDSWFRLDSCRHSLIPFQGDGNPKTGKTTVANV